MIAQKITGKNKNNYNTPVHSTSIENHQQNRDKQGKQLATNKQDKK